MPRAPLRFFLSLLLVSCLLPALASAAPSAADKRAAEALFQEGRAHVEDGDFSLACPKFLASYKLNPGGGTLLNLADCYQRIGQTASAYQRFKEAAELAKKTGKADREATALDRIQLLEPRLTRLEIHAPEGELSISKDGIPLPKEEIGPPVPIDPGPHTIVATAPGKKPWSLTIDAVEAGKTYKVDVPALPPEGDIEPPKTPEKPREEPRKDRKDEPAAGGGQRTAGLVLGGAGLVIVGVGGYFGLRTISKWSDSRERCNDKGCDREGVDLASDAKTSGFISTLGIAAGGAMVVAGIVLYFTAPRAAKGEKKIAPLLGPGLWGVAAGGSF